MLRSCFVNSNRVSVSNFMHNFPSSIVLYTGPVFGTSSLTDCLGLGINPYCVSEAFVLYSIWKIPLSCWSPDILLTRKNPPIKVLTVCGIRFALLRISSIESG